MKILLEIPKEFETQFKINRFEVTLLRLIKDAHLIAGDYEEEVAFMLIDAFRNAEKILEGKEEYIKQLIKKDTPLPVYLDNGELVYDTAICENCNERYEIDYEHYKYCPNCGQRLDWPEVDKMVGKTVVTKF